MHKITKPQTNVLDFLFDNSCVEYKIYVIFLFFKIKANKIFERDNVSFHL